MVGIGYGTFLAKVPSQLCIQILLRSVLFCLVSFSFVNLLTPLFQKIIYLFLIPNTALGVLWRKYIVAPRAKIFNIQRGACLFWNIEQQNGRGTVAAEATTLQSLYLWNSGLYSDLEQIVQTPFFTIIHRREQPYQENATHKKIAVIVD